MTDNQGGGKIVRLEIVFYADSAFRGMEMSQEHDGRTQVFVLTWETKEIQDFGLAGGEIWIPKVSMRILEQTVEGKRDAAGKK